MDEFLHSSWGFLGSDIFTTGSADLMFSYACMQAEDLWKTAEASTLAQECLMGTTNLTVNSTHSGFASTRPIFLVRLYTALTDRSCRRHLQSSPPLKTGVLGCPTVVGGINTVPVRLLVAAEFRIWPVPYIVEDARVVARETYEYVGWLR